MKAQTAIIIVAIAILFAARLAQCDVAVGTDDNTLYVQLQWYFEPSATSVWMPLALNYYAAENLTVVVNQGGPNINVQNYVQHEVADIGFGFLAVMLTSYDTGDAEDEMVAVAQIDQASSFRLVSLKSSGIHTLEDMQDKRVCMWTAGGEDLTIRAALAMHNVTYQRMSLGGTPYVLLAGDCDVIQVLSYNELGLLLQMTNPETGKLVQYEDINIFNMDADAFSMEDLIFVRKSWLAVPENQARLRSFLRAVVKTAIFARDDPAKMLNYYNPSSTVDQWQLYITNQLAWHNATQTNTYGHVNANQVNQTIANVIKYMIPNLNATHVFDNTYIDEVVAQLKSEGYMFNVQVPTAPLTWCLDIGSTRPHICRGDERVQRVVDFTKGYRIFNIVLSCILLVMTLSVGVAVVLNRNKIPILRAAPNYLYMMIGGAATMLVGVIVYNFGVTVASCHIYIWCISLGFTFLFAPYICKTWRIYRMVDMSTLQARRQPPLLFASLMIAAVVINVALLLVFSALKPMLITPVVSPFDIYTQYRTCHWNHTVGYIIVGYTGLLLLGSVCLAFMIRNVKFKYVNDSGDMSAAAFLTAAIVAFTLAVVFLQSNPNTSILIQSLGICVVAALNTSLMFAQRLYHCATLDTSEMLKKYKSYASDISTRSTHSGNRSTMMAKSDYSLGVTRTRSKTTSGTMPDEV